MQEGSCGAQGKQAGGTRARRTQLEGGAARGAVGKLARAPAGRGAPLKSTAVARTGCARFSQSGGCCSAQSRRMHAVHMRAAKRERRRGGERTS